MNRDQKYHWKTILFILTVIVGTFVNSSAQREFYPPNMRCGKAAFLFIDNTTTAYSQNFAMSNADFPNPSLCFGAGAPHNLGWYRFVAKGGGVLRLTFKFDPSSCQLQQGIQAGVLGDCSGAEVFDCNAGCNTTDFELSFVADQGMEDYFLWVDGCNGDVCEYEFQVQGDAVLCEEDNSPPIRLSYYVDENDNCRKEIRETPLLRCETKFTSSTGQNIFALTSNDMGFTFLPDDEYLVTISNNLFDLEFCPDSIMIDVNPMWTDRNLEIGGQTEISCPYTIFNVVPPTGANRFRCDPAERKTLIIEYYNMGTAHTNNDSIIIKVSPFMSDVAFSRPNRKIENFTYLVSIEDIDPGLKRDIAIEYLLDCSTSDLGKDVCISVYDDKLSCPDLASKKDSITYCSPIRLAYDPNDILVRPTGLTEEKYIEKTDELDYRIRFQNLGNDTAYNVSIVVETGEFEPASVKTGFSSHNTVAKFGEYKNKIEFLLNDINLVDDKTNEAESHGYITFRLKLDKPVELERVEHFANIFFDFNPPIQTNIDFHTIAPEFFVQTNDVHLCPYDEYQGKQYFQDTTWADTVILTGPDSLYITNIIVHEAYHLLIDTAVFKGDSILGIPIDTDTFVQKNYFTQWDCDSLITYKVSIKNSTSVNDQNENRYKFFPNPVINSKVMIIRNSAEDSELITFFDITGKEMLKQTLNGTRNDITFPSGVSSGVLLYKITGAMDNLIQSGTIILAR